MARLADRVLLGILSIKSTLGKVFGYITLNFNLRFCHEQETTLQLDDSIYPSPAFEAETSNGNAHPSPIKRHGKHGRRLDSRYRSCDSNRAYIEASEAISDKTIHSNRLIRSRHCSHLGGVWEV